MLLDFEVEECKGLCEDCYEEQEVDEQYATSGKKDNQLSFCVNLFPK